MATITTAERALERQPAVAAGLPAPSALTGPRSGVVRVFVKEPDLLAGLDATNAALLRQRTVVPRLSVERGPWEPLAPSDRMYEWLGLLVIDGLFIRTVEIHGRRCHELVGAGDVLRPREDIDGSLGQAVSWSALERGSMAVLDERFSAVAARWPSIMVHLLERSVQRSRSLAINLAIVHVRRADLRLCMLLWHLADRWGRVTGKGVHLPLRLTHEILAELACMRRPTASGALNGLERSGQIARRGDGTWLLTGRPPSPHHAVDERAQSLSSTL